jgi:hypothetical protein
MTAFAYFERLRTGHKVRVLRDLTFPTIAAALAHFGDRVIDSEIAEDGMACDLAVIVRGALNVYSIEKV